MLVNIHRTGHFPSIEGRAEDIAGESKPVISALNKRLQFVIGALQGSGGLTGCVTGTRLLTPSLTR